MANYTGYMSLYKPNRADSVEVDTSLSDNFQAIDTLLGSALQKGSTKYTDLAARFFELEQLISNNKAYVNVKDYGAVGDGRTDNTSAFRRAINEIKNRGGGTLYIPNDGGNAKYFIDTGLELTDNIRVLSNGATLLKTGGASDYYIFKTLSHGKTGYGSSPSNLTFEGICFRGDFEGNRGASVTLLHSEHVTFERCCFVECVIAGHAIDLGGCNHVLIDNCVFLGQKAWSNREYCEAIQIDNAVSQGSGGIDDAASYDGLPTVNTTVQNCRFLPLTLNGTKYRAPNPLGSHTRVQYQWYQNIKFINNYVEDAIEITPEISAYAQGWLHFYHIDGLEVSGNTFKVTDGKRARVLGLYTIDTGILVSDYQSVNPTQQPYVPQPPKNVKVLNNTFIGFNNPNSDRIIFLQGRKYNGTEYLISDVSVHGNTFRDCFDTAGGQYRNASSDLVHADYTQFLSVKDNACENVRRLVYANNCYNTTVGGNSFKFAHWVPISFAGGGDATIFDNDVVHHAGGFYFRDVRRISVFSNNLTLDKASAKTDYNQIMAFNNCQRMTIHNNDINGSNNIDNGIHVYGGSNLGKVTYNIVTGVTTPVAQGSAKNITVV